MIELLIAATTWAVRKLGYESREPGMTRLLAVLLGAHRVVGGHVCGWPNRGRRA